MADKYKEYLAARVLSEGKPVTYRLLSRALKVHVNIAKQMLYDFHTTQNSKKPKSVHATFLLTGRKHSVAQTNGKLGRDGEDTVMQSSPYMSSVPDPYTQEDYDEPPVPKTSIVLVREEQLEATKAEFEEITSIHIYSLEPGPLENLALLAVCNQEIVKEYSKDDPLDRWRLYGCAHNQYIKRRTTKYSPTGSTAKPAPKTAAKPAAAPAAKAKEEPAAIAKKGVSSEPASGRSTSASTANAQKKGDMKAFAKKEKQDIFKSFAKAKAKPKAEAKSQDSTPAATEDEPMEGMSADEGDDDDAPEVKFDQEKEAQSRKARSDRQEKLRKMMEESDEEMADVEEEKESQDAAVLDATPAKEPTPEPVVTSHGGRRRGRRKVLKKKKVKDADGYLVTKEEWVWEDFSEDEPEPKKLKPKPKPTNTAKKGKMGQGSIANFFKKA